MASLGVSDSTGKLYLILEVAKCSLVPYFIGHVDLPGTAWARTAKGRQRSLGTILEAGSHAY